MHQDVELAVLFLEGGEEGFDLLSLETSHWKPPAPGNSSIRPSASSFMRSF